MARYKKITLIKILLVGVLFFITFSCSEDAQSEIEEVSENENSILFAPKAYLSLLKQQLGHNLCDCHNADSKNDFKTITLTHSTPACDCSNWLSITTNTEERIQIIPTHEFLMIPSNFNYTGNKVTLWGYFDQEYNSIQEPQFHYCAYQISLPTTVRCWGIMTPDSQTLKLEIKYPF